MKYMKLFSKNKKTTSGVVVIGCNKTGIALAECLLTQGFALTLVDKCAGAFEHISSAYMGDLALGDATDDQMIAKAYFQAARAIFVVTDSDNMNIFTAQILRQKLGNEKKIISHLNDSLRAPTYRALGMETVCAENLFANEIGRSLFSLMDGEQI
jgi:Trk K+ transport system NAD-binding subunit